MIEVDLINNCVREMDLSTVDEIHCQKCGEKVKGRMGRNVYTTEYDVHKLTKALLCSSCKKKLTAWAAPKLAEYEKALVMQWLTSEETKERHKIDEKAILIKHIIETHDCFLCKKLGWVENCELAKKGCDNFFNQKLEKIFK